MLESSQNSYISPGGTGHDIVNKEEKKKEMVCISPIELYIHDFFKDCKN